MELKEKLQEYTRAEFSALVERIKRVQGSRQEHNNLVQHFDQVVMHPRGADLLFYPDTHNEFPGSGEVDDALNKVRTWHNDNGHLAFKDDTLPHPRVKTVSSAPQPSAKDQAWKASSENLVKVQVIAKEISEATQSLESAFSTLESLLVTVEVDSEAQLTTTVDSVGVELLESKLANVEAAEHAVTRSLYNHENLKFTIQFAKNDAQRSRSYSHLDRELQVSIFQQINDSSDHYLALQPVLLTRQQALHVRTEVAVARLEMQLIRLASTLGAGPLKDVTVFSSTVRDIDSMPQVLTPYSDISGSFDVVLPSLKHAIRSAVSGLAWDVTSEGIDQVVRQASVMSFQFDKPGCGEPFAICLPLAELTPTEGVDWQYLAQTNAEVDLPLRMNSDVAKNRHGKLSQGLREIIELAHVYVVPTHNTMVESKVRVHAAVWNADSAHYRFTRPGLPENTVLWTSDSFSSDNETSSAGRKRFARPGYIAPVTVPVVEAIPFIEDLSFDDCIVVFPSDSGIQPLYVMFKGTREYPGVASGTGHSVIGDWLQDSIDKKGAPIPSRIADQLRGKIFKRFSLFRDVFWKAVANSAELSAPFSVEEVAAMKEGRSPSMVVSPATMQSGKLVIRYVVSPSDGGDAYDMDNMRIAAQQHL